MADKLSLLLIYLGLVLVIGGWPFLRQATGPVPPARWLAMLFPASLLTAAFALAIARGVPSPGAPLVLSLVLPLPLLSLGAATLLAGAATLPLLAGVTWWAPALEPGPGRGLLLVLLGVAGAALPGLWPGQRGVPAAPVLVVSAMLGLAAAAFTGVFGSPLGFVALWHQWGAYVSPAEAMLAGGVPFRDFPVQYGLGPLLLVAAACGDHCWRGTYFAVAGANVAYLLALTGCALCTLRHARRGEALLVLAALACAALVWTGYPPDLLGPTATPSVGGMRFLPVALLLLHVLLPRREGRPGDWVGHGLWLLGLAWSPEAAFQASLLWWPSLALRRAEAVRGLWPVGLVLLAGAARAVLALGLGLLGLGVAFRLAFGEWPSPGGYLTYVINPPGVLMPNPLGPVWLALLGLAAAMPAIGRRRGSAACALAFLAVGAYYLGRSHDNNLLNLFPFLVLVLGHALTAQPRGAAHGFARVALAGIVAWPATFGLAAWTAARHAGEAGTIGPARLASRIDFTAPDAWALLDAWLAALPGGFAPAADAAAALAWLRASGEPPPVWMNAAMLLPSAPPGIAWTGMNNLANFALLPQATVEAFIGQGAVTFRRDGWLLVDRVQANPYASLFARHYRTVEERPFGGYSLLRVQPR